MAYTNVWNDTLPTGSEAANTIATLLRQSKVDVEQRFMDIFAIPDFTVDPLRPYGLKFTDVQDAKLFFGDNAGTPRKILLRDKADTTTYVTLASTGITAPLFTGNVTGAINTAAQPNITSLGTLTGLTVSGNTVIGTTPAIATSIGSATIPTTSTISQLFIGHGGTFGGNSSEADIGFNFYYNSGWKYLNTNTTSRIAFYQSGTRPIEFMYAASGIADAAVTWNTAGYFDTTGLLILSDGLNVTGSIASSDALLVTMAAGSGSYTAQFQAGTTSGSSFGVKISAGTTAADQNTVFRKADNVTELGRITGNGIFAWGTTVTTGASGGIVLSNSTAFCGVNAAGTAAKFLIYLDSSDRVNLGASGSALVNNGYDANIPASAAAAGKAGTISWDAGSGFLYLCTAGNTWKRVAIASW